MISENVLMVIAGDIEKLLLEKQEAISDSYTKIQEGIKISLGINLDHSSKGVVVNYSLSFPLEPQPKSPLKATVKLTHTINEAQSEMFEGGING